MSARAIVEAESPKGVFKHLPRRVRVVAFSGEWVVNPRNGLVQAFYPDSRVMQQEDPKLFREYNGIIAFDLDEYQKYWHDLPEGIDISDIGYWRKNGSYVAADEQYRQDIKTGGIAR